MTKKINNSVINGIEKELAVFYDGINIDRKCLNSGAPNSRVYKFEVKKNKEQKIVKILNNKYSAKKEYQQEKKAMENCSSGSIIKFEKTGKYGKHYYFTFPCIKGKTLWELLKEKRSFEEAEVREFLLNMAHVIDELKDDGIIHQDIKPANIIYNSKDDFVILDLGISLFNLSDNLTKKGKGPLHYLSPEQESLCKKRVLLNQCKISYASDLYSLGLIGLEMVAGKELKRFINLDEMHKIEEKIETELGVSGGMKDLLKALLRESPSERICELNSIIPGITENSKCSLDDIIWTQEIYQDTLNSYMEEGGLFDEIDVSKFGLIVSGDYIHNEKKLIKKVKKYRDKGMSLMVDPRTMRLENKNIGQLKSRAYRFQINLISDVLEFEKQFNPNFYIAPYFYVSNVDDIQLEKCITCFEKFINEDSDVNSDNTFFAIAIRESLLKNKKQLLVLIDTINFYNKIKNVYVVFETKMDGSAPNQDVDVLLGIKDFVEKIGLRKKVFWSLSDITAFYLLGSGLNNFSICPSFTNRKNDFDNFDSKPGHRKQPTPRTFVPWLMNDILRDEELFKKSRYGTPADNELKYSGVFFNKDVRDSHCNKCHFIESVRDYRKELAGKNSDGIKKHFLKKLESADRIYKAVQTKYKIIFKNDTNDSFVNAWQSVFKD